MKQLLTVLVFFSITTLFVACNSNTAEESSSSTAIEKETKPSFDLAAAKKSIEAANAAFGNFIKQGDSV